MLRIIFSTVLVLVMSPAAFAGEVELTTYYPAPYGEYKNLSTTDNASLATAAGTVHVGSAANHTVLAVDHTLTLAPVTGAASVQSGGTAGSLRYSSDAGGVLLLRNNVGWAPIGGSGVNDHSAAGYIRIGNVQIAWGRGSFTGSGVGDRYVAVTFPAAFISTPAVSLTADWPEDVERIGTSRNTLTKNGFTAMARVDPPTSGGFGYSWIAVGRWQ